MTLQNDVTFASLVQGASTLNVNGRVLTHTGASFTYGSVVGSGTVRMQPVSGASTINGIARSFAPELKIVSGTVTSNDISLNGSLTVDPGATLSLAGFGSGIGVRGNVTNNGTVNVSGSGSPTFSFQGNTFTNNGSVATRVFFTPYFGAPAPFAQNLAGTGSWAGAGTALYVTGGTSTLTLQNDVTYAGGILYSDGRINTGAFTLSLPCTTAWQGAGDVVGNVRRTNLAACPGAIFAFGSPFTTIQFTSGTPPTEITVNVGFAAPAGFPNAARRTYLITPFGGSGYTATLRLHYLDSELNGNAESSLQLWRNNGANWTLQGATNRDTTNNWVEYSGVTQFSPWTISGPLAPTAASVSVSGQVRTASGAGIRNAVITLTAQDGSTRIARSSSFGYYRFDGIIAGETYILNISTKRFTFAQPTIVVSVLDEVAGLDFVADPFP